jgi:hypothetical protein
MPDEMRQGKAKLDRLFRSSVAWMPRVLMWGEAKIVRAADHEY